jgi:hypothetical protein
MTANRMETLPAGIPSRRMVIVTFIFRDVCDQAGTVRADIGQARIFTRRSTEEARRTTEKGRILAASRGRSIEFGP